MTTIQISSKLAEKLNRLAEREHKSVDEVLENLLETGNIAESSPEDEEPGGAELLKAIRKARINSGHSDTAEHSREILHTEFPKHLLSRMDATDETKE